MSEVAPVMTTEDWLIEHEGHDVAKEEKRVSIKLMKYWVCRDCKAKHTYDMETVIDDE